MMDTDERSVREDVVCVVGLGYVGLPLAYEFDRAGYDVIGFDVDAEKIEQLRAGVDPTGDVGSDALGTCDVRFTARETELERGRFVLVAVPTPVDDLENPDLKYVRAAGETIGRNLREGATVVLESTVYPGATREILVPAIEATSGLTGGEDFFVGYSPERIVPGDDERDLRNVVKIVSGQDEETLEELAALYESVVDAGVHRAPEIEVAEAAKCIENIQRDLNIALVNELAIACDRLDVDPRAILEAAGTKWNFHEYRPGLVGGHCIPVDPFYIIYESERNGFSPKLIQQAREVNEYMPKHVAELVLKRLNACGKVPRESTVLILGLAYKPNVGDVRTSVIDGTIAALEDFDVEVVGHDPCADPDEMREEFDVEIRRRLSVSGVDGVVLATPHDRFLEVDYARLAERMAPNPFLVDVDGALDPTELAETELDYTRI